MIKIDKGEELIKEVKELADKMQKQFLKQNDFILEILNDKRIPEDVKNEYAEKYNELIIKDHSIK